MSSQGGLEQIRRFENALRPDSRPDPSIFNYYRLIILKGLVMGEFVSFQLLRELTAMPSAGNLASHLKVLEDLELVKYHQGRSGRRNLAFYEITDKGRRELRDVEDFLQGIFEGFKSP